MGRRRHSPTGRAPTPWQRRRWRTMLVLVLLLLLISPALIWRTRARAELNQALFELRERGVPTTLNELAAWEPQDPQSAEADAAFDLVFQHYKEMSPEAFQDLPKFDLDEARLLAVPFSEETRSALEARVFGNESTVEQFFEASQFSRYRVLKDYASGNTGNIRDLSRHFEVLAAHICLLAAAGEGDLAMEAAHAGIRVARACRQSPFTHVLNQSAAYENMVVATIPAVAVRTRISGDALYRLEALIADDDWTAAVAYALNGDRCRELVWNLPRRPREVLWEMASGVYDRRLVEILRYMDFAPELVHYPPWERWNEAEARGFTVLQYGWTSPASKTYPKAAVAVLRFFHDHGTPPGELTQLVPGYLDAIPRAAYGDGAIGYEHNGVSFTLYEVDDTTALPAGGAKHHERVWPLPTAAAAE